MLPDSSVTALRLPQCWIEAFPGYSRPVNTAFRSSPLDQKIFTVAAEGPAPLGGQRGNLPRRGRIVGTQPNLPRSLAKGAGQAERRPGAAHAARVDLGAAWDVQKLPEDPGLDADGILDALVAGDLSALVVGGVDPADVPQLHGPEAKKLRKALRKAFVVALEVRASELTELADVVFPIAPTTDKAGSFVNWEGRVRPFGRVLESPTSLPDVRVLAGIAEERGRPIGVRSPEQAAAEMQQLGPWEGARAAFEPVEAQAAPSSGLVLASWKQLIDDGRMQDGDDHYRATARRPVVLVSQATLDGLGAPGEVSEGDLVTLTGPLGSLNLPVGVADLAEGVVWAPASAPGSSVRHLVGPAGSPVTVRALSQGGN